MNDIAIPVENISKQYRIGQREAAYKTLRESVMNRLTFHVQRFNDFNGIGRNGAGKSTLLKITEGGYNYGRQYYD
jgi:ABC-type polysaccharide/polyol phosphate transport system ATPase subunit